MSARNLPPESERADFVDRRKEQRFEVEVHGELRYDGKVFAVQIADISGSGALVFMNIPPKVGSQAELWIEDFGALRVQIMHAGEHFCGVEVADAAAHRGRLLAWLAKEIATGGPAAAVR